MARHDGPQINLLQDGLVVILSRGQLFKVGVDVWVFRNTRKIAALRAAFCLAPA